MPLPWAVLLGFAATLALPHGDAPSAAGLAAAFYQAVALVFGGATLDVTPVKLVVGLLLLTFALLELLPRLRDLTFKPSYMPVGGLLSGFFDGLAGMQGALRSAFLVRAGLSKEAFIATGVVTAVLVDVSRLGVYTRSLVHVDALDYPLLTATILSAFLGAFAGSQYLKKMTMPSIQRLVAAALFVAALGLVMGVL